MFNNHYICDIREDENYISITDSEKVIKLLRDNFGTKETLILQYMSEAGGFFKTFLIEVCPIEILSGEELNKTQPLENGTWDYLKYYMKAYCPIYDEERFFRMDMVSGILIHKQDIERLFGSNSELLGK